MPTVTVTDEEMADLLKETGTKKDTEKKREKVLDNFQKNVENEGMFSTFVEIEKLFPF